MIRSDPCDFLEWDTGFFGFRIGRVRGHLLSEVLVREIDLWCQQQAIRCLYFLASPNDTSTVSLAEDNGFRLVDVRLTLEAGELGATHSVRSVPGSAALLRAARREDLGALTAIARVSHRDSRFYFDLNFPRPLADSLYETWITTSCSGYADTVLVADMDGAPVGYVTCHSDDDGRSGRIGLIAVGDGARGKGIGRSLVVGALDWFAAHRAREVSVVTQARNSAAQRLYQRCGFLTKDVQLWYHKWY